MELIWGEFDWGLHGSYVDKIVEARTSELVRKYIEQKKESKLDFKGREIKLIVQYYKDKNPVRAEEIRQAVQNNINNPFFSSINIVAECDIDLDLNNRVTVFPGERLSYSDAFSFVEDNSIYLLTNSDCYFGYDVVNLDLIDFSKPRFIPLTRWEYIGNELDIGRNVFAENGIEKKNEREYKELPLLEPWSSDAWAFTKETLSEINPSLFDEKLGVSLCEILTINQMIVSGVQCNNIGVVGYVKPIHIHKSQVRRAENWERELKKILPGIYPIGERSISESIDNCWRVRSPLNWLDKDQKEHAYTSFVTTNIDELA